MPGTWDLFRFILSALQWARTSKQLYNGEARSQYRRYRSLHKYFLYAVKRLREDLPKSPENGRVLRDIDSLLRDFFTRLGVSKACTPKNGSSKLTLAQKASLFLKIVKWPEHADGLELLRREIETKINLIGITRTFEQSATGLIDYFTLEDAQGTLHRADRTVVSTWLSLQAYLLDMFPEQHSAYELIKSRAYVLRRGGVDILCNSPTLEAFNFETSFPQYAHVRMSVIFPYREEYRSACPGCGKVRAADFRMTILAWFVPNTIHPDPPKPFSKIDPATDTRTSQGCRLELCFKESGAGKPDMLIAHALEDICRYSDGGKIGFMQDMESEIKEYTAQLLRDGMQYQTALKQWTRHVLADDIRPASSPGAIKNFSRVILYRPTNPDLRLDGAVHRRRSRVREGLRTAIRNIKAQSSPFLKAATLLRTRFWFARQRQAVLSFLTSITEGNKALTDSPSHSHSIAKSLMQATATSANVCPPMVRLRCLLWIYEGFLQRERKISSFVLDVLQPYCSDSVYEDPSQWFFRIFSLPHIVLLPVWRCTFDVIEDVAEYIKGTTPEYPPSTMRALIFNSREIVLCSLRDGNLQTYFRNIQHSSLSGTHLQMYQQLLEKIAGPDEMDVKEVGSFSEQLEAAFETGLG